MTDTVPVVDLANSDESLIVRQVAEACSTAGFFQVINHGLPDQLVKGFRVQCRAYFTKLPIRIKNAQRRRSTNARGFFDDELTKQRLDWKQALDVGVPGSRDWNIPDNDPRNACLDGFNQMPSSEELPGFRETVVQYFQACETLSDRLARIMHQGIIPNSSTVATNTADTNHDNIIDDLRENHTSYLRMNYYPVFNEEEAEKEEKKAESPLGISPHKDAGFLTVLLQDDDCYSLQVWINNEWQTVVPVEGAFTINTGDMAQIWSNGQYKAPLHRVLTNTTKERFSAPFFYNPGYKSVIQPAVSESGGGTNELHYYPCIWGYFRAVRFAGDFTNLGVEIQIEDYEVTGGVDANDNDEHGQHPSLRRQRIFDKSVKVDEPFSVEDFRAMLQE